MSDYRVLHLRDEPAQDLEDPAVPPWIPVRHRLGVRAFGTNAYRAADAGDVIVEPHTEWSDDPAEPPQEEMYVVVLGHATFTVNGEEIDAPAGTIVFLPEPTAHREAVAVEAGTTVLAVGGAPGTAYATSQWEKDWREKTGEPAGPVGDTSADGPARPGRGPVD
jgi:mannose-6-phosphate isomerase-like protein (cupin superfamily)